MGAARPAPACEQVRARGGHVGVAVDEGGRLQRGAEPGTRPVVAERAGELDESTKAPSQSEPLVASRYALR
jgi:hypothetical protein